MNKNSQQSRTVQKQLKDRKIVETSVLRKAFTRCSQWDDKDEFLDVIYWSRQIIGIIAGIIWGLIPLKGFFGIALFVAVNAGLIYLYFTNFQKIDDEEYGGSWELTKEGFMSSFAGFLKYCQPNCLQKRLHSTVLICVTALMMFCRSLSE